jgi:hypothetical protein
LTFAGTFLSTVSDVLDYTGLVGQALSDFLDDVDMENERQYCCSKEEIKNWKDCYWAVCLILYLAMGTTLANRMTGKRWTIR